MQWESGSLEYSSVALDETLLHEHAPALGDDMGLA